MKNSLQTERKEKNFNSKERRKMRENLIKSLRQVKQLENFFFRKIITAVLV